MFGGLCYLLKGNMLLGVHKDTLILRLGVEESETALGQPGVRLFDITGKPMKGWVMVEKNGFEGGKLGEWIAKARNFVEMLPAK